MEGAVETTQAYLRNTPILRTEIRNAEGAGVEIIDFAPRYRHLGRQYRPLAFVRIVRLLAGAPRIRIRLRPMANYGERRLLHAPPAPTTSATWARPVTLRLTTDAPVSHIVEERAFRLEEPIGMFLGPDEGMDADVSTTTARMLRETTDYWRGWVRTLSVPLEWQEAVIRAAITLKLCAYEETGAIVAALTTSLPEHAATAGAGRNWDYRYCWLRDAYYVVQALNRPGRGRHAGELPRLPAQPGGPGQPRRDARRAPSGHSASCPAWARAIAVNGKAGHVQPVYGVGLEPVLTEWIAPHLPGYRGIGPVRVGNQAHEHLQHDVYGQIVLSTVQAFFDERLLRPANADDFRALEPIGERAFELHDKPDASLWEFRGREAVHTYSSVMCWAACDRLGNAAAKLGLTDRAPTTGTPARPRCARPSRRGPGTRPRAASPRPSRATSWTPACCSWWTCGSCPPTTRGWQATMAAVEHGLRRGPYMLRYAMPDDFGLPQTAFNFCTFWLIEALHLSGRTGRGAQAVRGDAGPPHGRRACSPRTSPSTAGSWGELPADLPVVGLINCAARARPAWTSSCRTRRLNRAGSGAAYGAAGCGNGGWRWPRAIQAKGARGRGEGPSCPARVGASGCVAALAPRRPRPPSTSSARRPRPRRGGTNRVASLWMARPAAARS